MKWVALLLLIPTLALAADGRILRVPSVPDSQIVHREQPSNPSPDVRVSGVVKLRLLVGKDGHVEQVKFISGHPLLTPAAMQAARRWVFKPFEKDGEPVRALTEIEIPFDSPAK